MATLENVTLELMEVNENLKGAEEISKLTNEYLNLSVDTFKQGFAELLEFFTGRTLSDLEEAAENRRLQERMLAALEARDESPEEKKKEEGMSALGIGAILAGLMGVTVGVISGWLKAIKGFYTLLTPGSIQAAAAKAIDGIRDIFKSLSTVIGERVKMLRASLTSSLTRFSSFFDSLKGGAVGKVFTAIGQRISGIVNIFSQAGDEIAKITQGPVAKMAVKFADIGAYLKTFGAAIARVAGIVGKLFAPIAVIMTLWDTVKGAIEGYEEEGIIGGIKGAIKGFFNALIFGPLDMIKSAISWVLGVFGFENAEKALDSFSFADLFSSLIDGIHNAVVYVIDWFKNQLGFTGEGLPSVTNLLIGLITMPYDAVRTAIASLASMLGAEDIAKTISDFSFKDALSGMANGAKEFLKSALRAILPTPNSNKPWYDIGNIVSKAIPDSVYKFAGINPDTGEVEAPPEPPPTTEAAPTERKSLEELSQMSMSERARYEDEQNKQFELERKKKREERFKNVDIYSPEEIARSKQYDEMNLGQYEKSELTAPKQQAPSVSSVSTSNNVNNNNTNVIKSYVSPTRQPNSPSDIIWDNGANVAA